MAIIGDFRGEYLYKNVTADTLVKTGSGVLHTVSFIQADAAPTAGTVDIWDGTSAAGTKILSWTLTTAIIGPVCLMLDVRFETGLYVDFTTTADLGVLLAYA